MDDLSRFCCLNSQCPDHGKRGAGNLSVTSRYGPEKVRCMLRCRTCKARFSERKGTVFFGARLSPEKVEKLLPRGPHARESLGTERHRLATVEWPVETLDPFFNANTVEDIAQAERLATLDGS